jgi:hypothetical protein
MTVQTNMTTETIRHAAALQVASELDDLKLGAVILYASAAHACALKGHALVSAVADAFDACAKRSVEVGDTRADDEPASADIDTTVFRYRRGARTVLQVSSTRRGEGSLMSAAHTGRLVRLALAEVDAYGIPQGLSAVEVPAQEIPEGYTIHAGTIRDDETGEDDTIYQWEHVSGEVSGHVRGDGAFVRDMFGSWDEALADIMEHSAPDTED